MQVTSEDVAAYLPRVERFARSFAKAKQGVAEFDDLVQEGLLKVFLLLRDELPVTNEAIKNAMRDWVRLCHRKGIAHTDTMTEAEMDYTSGIHSAPGRRMTAFMDEDGSWKGGRAHLGYVPATA